LLTSRADALARVEVLETGGLFGGFPDFHHLFVRVCRTITSAWNGGMTKHQVLRDHDPPRLGKREQDADGTVAFPDRGTVTSPFATVGSLR
jgi:hypothetical protein